MATAALDDFNALFDHQAFPEKSVYYSYVIDAIEHVRDTWPPYEPLHVVTLAPRLNEEMKGVGSYLVALRKTLLIAMFTILVSAVVGAASISALVVFAITGSSFIHPYLAAFFGLISIGLLTLGVMSALYVKRDTESCIRKILANCSQQY